METTGYKDWIESVENAFNELKEKVKKIFVLGLSMGGTLTLYCASKYKIDGAIIINAAVDLPSFKKMFNDPNTSRFIAGIGSDIKEPGIKEWAYDRTPKKCIKEILELTTLTKNDLSKISCPILIFKSTDDHVVPPNNQDYILSHVSSKNKELIELKNSYHVATLDYDQEYIIKQINNFIKQTLQQI